MIKKEQQIFLKAYAKINLFLHILGKNEKNYHLLDSIFVFADIGDDIILTRSDDNDDISLKTDGEFKFDIPADKSNLVIKAANIFGVEKGVCIHLSKNVPVSSGIGGGSADAGAVIRGLCSLCNLHFSKEETIKKATLVGADVPSCVYAKSCRIGGIGEKITPFELKDKYNIILINPLKKILTKDIFSVGIKKFSDPAVIYDNDLINSLQNTRNDLLIPALQIVPEIMGIINALKATKNCLFANMSGSGATCFALYENDEDLYNAEKILRKQFNKYWIKTGKII